MIAAPEWRVRGRAAKAAALFLLPLPLAFAILASVVAADAGRLALTSGALASFWTAGVLAWRGLRAETAYVLGHTFDLPRLPMKFISAILTALGATIAALAGAQSPTAAAVFAVMAFVGHLAFYGFDMRRRRITVTETEGVDTLDVAGQLERAHARLRQMDAAARRIAAAEVTDRLNRITTVGRSILDEIARDPREATHARRFLNLYLESAERVTLEYARAHRRLPDGPVEQNFRQLLIDLERTFGEQHKRLLEHEAMSLDVEIEVLNARMTREPATARLETER